MYRVAAASTDGVVVNQHFGHADRFQILDVDPSSETFHFVETREVIPCCQAFDHTVSAFDKVLAELQDTQAIFVSKIGMEAAIYLEQHGKTIYQTPYPIVPILEKVIQEKRWEVDQWQYPMRN